MPRSEFDDPAFLARLRQKDADAWRVLIRRLHASLVGVSAAVIGSRAQGEEVVQDSWLAAFAGIARFEGRSTLSTWIFSIVLNRARTRARARIRRAIDLATDPRTAAPHTTRRPRTPAKSTALLLAACRRMFGIAHNGFQTHPVSG